LIVLQVVLPNISLLGHLSGIFIGLFVISGLCQILLPSLDFYKSVDQWSCIGSIYRLPNYIRCPDVNMVCGDFFRCDGGVPGIVKPIYVLFQQLYFVLEAFLHILGCPADRLASCCRSTGDTICPCRRNSPTIPFTSSSAIEAPSASSVNRSLGSLSQSQSPMHDLERPAADGRGNFRTLRQTDKVDSAPRSAIL